MLLTQPQQLRIDLPLAAIAEICRRHGVSELAVFGSALREDFQDRQSDIDFLVKFINNDAGPWMCKLLYMEEELSLRLGRRAELTDWNGVLQSTNPYRRQPILESAQVVYVA